MTKDNYIIPHYPFYNEPKLVREAQEFVQSVRSLIEQIDAEYAIPDELKVVSKDIDSLERVTHYVADKQVGKETRYVLSASELKAAEYYLNAGDKGKRVATLCNELFKRMVLITINLDTHAKNYKADKFLEERAKFISIQLTPDSFTSLSQKSEVLKISVATYCENIITNHVTKRLKVYVHLNVAHNQDINEVAEILRSKAGVTHVDLVDSPPDIILVLEASERKQLAELTVKALGSIEHFVKEMQLIPVKE
jgi:hypothetical protein